MPAKPQIKPILSYPHSCDGYIDPTPYFIDQAEKRLQQLRLKLTHYQERLREKMKRYRGVIHESAASEMKHQEVMVLRAMVNDLQQEISNLEQQMKNAQA